MSNQNSPSDDKEILSSDGKTFFKVVEHSDNSFSLEKYIVCYDEEEEIEYTVRQTPDPTSRYETREIAIEDGKRILG